MGVLKNPRREVFAQGLAKGKTADAAYALAGFTPHRSNAARLSSNDSIRARVEELQGLVVERAVISRTWIMGMLQETAVKCLKGKDDERNPSAGNRALELMGKEIGMFVDRRLVADLNNMSEEELLEFLGGEPPSAGVKGAGPNAGSPPAGHA